MSSDRERERAAILARRKYFVATALAGIAVGGGACEPPRPCLQVPMAAPRDAEASPSPTDAASPAPSETVESPPQPCLEIAVPRPPPDAEAQPAPCLKMPPYRR